MAEPASALRIRQLTQIFGPTPQKFLAAVQRGIGKAELQAAHGHVLALRDVDIDVPMGAIQVVMGLSGSGKSTLIRHINRLIAPTAGQVWVRLDGREQDVLQMDPQTLLRYRREHTAMVFQSFALLPHLSVLDNVAFGLKMRAVPAPRRQQQALQWLARVGLAGDQHSYPHQLSGGMQQRVGLARALCVGAPLLLMDEAFSALDPLIRSEMQELLLALHQETGKTIVFITHDLDEALRLGHRIAILRDGAVVQQGTGEQIVLHPADDYIRSFVKDLNRGRVLRCQSLMHAAAPVAGPSVQFDLVIEEAARLLNAQRLPAANVLDAKGAHLGVIRLEEILTAMLPPAASR